MPQSHQEKLSLLKELIKLSQAHHSHDTLLEFDFIAQIAKKLGVSVEELNEIKSSDIEFTPPKSETDRIIQFATLAMLMGIDQHIDKAEKDFCRDVGLKLGLSPMAIEAVFNKMRNSKNKRVPPEELVKIFQTYHN